MARITFAEPQWGNDILLRLNTKVSQSETLIQWTPILSDIFVFFWPIFLFVLYMYGIMYHKMYHRMAALYIFISGVAAILVNGIIKLIVTKPRPDVALNLARESREALVLETLPQNTFPSDHAGMAFAIATSTFLRGRKNKDKKILALSFILYLMAVTMGVGRIAVGIHRPTDIIAGTIVGITVPAILYMPKIFGLLSTYVLKPLIRLQIHIRTHIFKRPEPQQNNTTI